MTENSTARTAIVTGAAAPTGIGYHVADLFAQDGWAVVLIDIDEMGVKSAAHKLADRHGVLTRAHVLDIADEQEVKNMAAAVRGSSLPNVAAVANIAGIPSTTSFLDVTLDHWRRIIDVNLTGTFLMCRAVLPLLAESGAGSIVNMSSVAAQQGGGIFSTAPYSSAKAGILGLTRALAREAAPLGVTVNAVAPGAVETSLRDTHTTPELERALTDSVPLGRQASSREVAELCKWLCGPAARYITGATHNINGGSYIS